MTKIIRKGLLLFIFCLLSLFTMSIFIKAESGEVLMIPETEFSDDLIIADIIVDSDNYLVDSTGYIDSTAGINQAILDCYNMGGGTVFLPSGKYRVSSNITVLPFVTLYGDYNDPDSPDFNGEYGTLIYADVQSSEENFPSLFTIGGSAGAVGLTVYYPFQTVENIKPYPYTFEIPSFASERGHADHMAPTIKDITLINSYKGVAASITASGSLPSAANEMIHLENIKGTVLYKGFELYNSSEYGVIKEISLNNNYWASAASFLSPPDKEDIDNFTKDHGLGMQIGDLEWVFFSDIEIEDYHTGIRIYDGLRRLISGQPEIYFIGQFYNLIIQNTKTALRVDNLYPNFGMTIASGYLSGEDYSINRQDTTNSVIQLIDTELNGKTYGDNIVISGADEEFNSDSFKDNYKRELDLSYLKKDIYNVINYNADLSGTYDSSDAIQNALDDARDNGGGIVYLPAGYYKLSNPITVYDNTMLRGSSSVNTRDEIGLSLGTVILSEYGYIIDESEALSGEALITVAGNNAGVSGIRIHYPNNKPNYQDGSIRLHTYTIRLMGDNNYVINSSLAGSTYGIEAQGTVDSFLESPFIQGVNGTYYRNGISLKYTKNAYLDELLSNGTVVSRSGLNLLFPNYYTNDWPSDSNGGLTGVYDNITRPNSYFIRINNSEDAFIKNSFTFASNSFLASDNSDIIMLNNAGDNLYYDGYLLRLNNSILNAVNLLRYSGTAYEMSNSTLSLFNRLSLLNNTEDDIYANVKIDDVEVVSETSATTDLPLDYHYDDSKDPEITYPIEDNDQTNDEPIEDSNPKLIKYFIYSAVIIIIVMIAIIFMRKRGN